MNPPPNLWPVFSGTESQLGFYVAIVMRLLVRGGDIGVTQRGLLSQLPKHVPSLAYYYEQSRQSGVSGSIRWVSRANAKLLWNALVRNPVVGKRGWGRRAAVYFRGPHGRFDTPASLYAYLVCRTAGGGCGIGRVSIEGSGTVYTVKDGERVDTFNNFKELAKGLGVQPHDLSNKMSPALSDGSASLMYKGKTISWKSSIEGHIRTLVSQKKAEILHRTDGSQVIVGARVPIRADLGPVGRTSTV